MSSSTLLEHFVEVNDPLYLDEPGKLMNKIPKLIYDIICDSLAKGGWEYPGKGQNPQFPIS